MKSVLVVATLTLGLIGASPSPSPSPSATPSAAPAAIVHMRDFSFDPETVTITVGQSVEWINDDAVLHSAGAEDKSWDSGQIDEGRTWTHAFEKAGTYAYFCDEHSYMRATVVVK